jgi:hypothetical protein
MKIEIDTNQIYFEELSKIVMKYLAENHNPHTSIIITSTSAELVQGKYAIQTDEFIPD